MSSYMLRLPEDESIVLSGPAAQQLISSGDGDAALLYIAALKNKGRIDTDKTRAALKWSLDRFQKALQSLSDQKLASLPEDFSFTPPPEPSRRAADRPMEYTRADIARALEGKDFVSLTKAVEEKLGPLTTPSLGKLLGLYDQRGLPSDVIYLLVCFCVERTGDKKGKGRLPTMTEIEKEGYAWARLDVRDQESAAAYIKKYHQAQEALPKMMRLLRLDERKPSPSEERYLMDWVSMDFEDSAIELAYDRTILNCKELKWKYMDKILRSWHEKGLHTVAQVEAGDGRRAASPQTAEADSIQEDMAQMEKLLQSMRRKKEGA